MVMADPRKYGHVETWFWEMIDIKWTTVSTLWKGAMIKRHYMDQVLHLKRYGCQYLSWLVSKNI